MPQSLVPRGRSLTKAVPRLALGAMSVGYALGAVAVATGPGRLTTYAGQSQVLVALTVLSGLALVAAGLGTAVLRPAAVRLGDLAMLAGFAWFAPVWIGWEGGPALIRSLGMVAGGFVVPLLLHITLAHPGGRPATTSIRAAVGLVYAETLLSAAGRALFYDPFADPACWANCTDNAFLVSSQPVLADVIQQIDLGFLAVACVGLVSGQLWRLVPATRLLRRGLWPTVASGVLVATATVVRSVELVRAPVESPASTPLRTAFSLLCAAALCLAGALGWAVLRAGAQRRAVAQVIADLDRAPRPGTLQSTLARVVGDPHLAITYRLPASGGFADAQGRRRDEPTGTPTRSVTPVLRGGRPVAVITHSVPASELDRGLGPAIRLALENEVLQVQLHAQVIDLRSSRARIVADGDARRRRLERDLHDGAQQHLVALTYGLRIARSSAIDEGGAEVAALLAAATEQAQVALEELRELAGGIFPVLLAEAGLGPAIAVLADQATIPVELGEVSDRRYATSVESAGYLVVAESVEAAVRKGSSYVAVDAAPDGDRLVITVYDDGDGTTDPMPHLLDRVGALGGSVEVSQGLVRAEIPCG